MSDPLNDLTGGGVISSEDPVTTHISPHDQHRATYRSRSRGLSSIDPKFISQSGINKSTDLETASGTSVNIQHLTARTYENHQGSLQIGCHYHYESSEINTVLVELNGNDVLQPHSPGSQSFTIRVEPTVQNQLIKTNARRLGGDARVMEGQCTSNCQIGDNRTFTEPCTNNVSKHSIDASWIVKRTLKDFILLDRWLQRCVWDRTFSGLPEILEQENNTVNEESVHDFLSTYLSRFSSLVGPNVTCGPVLNWLEIDNKGNHLIVTDDSDINTPAVGAAYAIKPYQKHAQDEINFEVGDMISVIDMPPGEESVWWKGKRGFDCGFFPSDYVEVIGTNVPSGLNLPGGIIRKDSLKSESPSEPSKPILRKSGKVVNFFRSFILSRPTRGKLKKDGILKERVFGCDLGEHLINTSKDVPKVLHHCSSFIEAKGLVDGIYRLSGISSNIQRLRVAFDEDRLPNLFEDKLVLQDIHCVSSCLKMYFRELPNPVCTFHLYDSFVDAARSPDSDRLDRLRAVVAQLPPPNYRTLEYLTRHLYRVSLRGSDTGMTAKNVAIVWAPNLLRSKSLEVGGVAALQGVGVQAIVTEYLIRFQTYLFRPMTLQIDPTFSKLLSLEEATNRAHSTTNNTDNQTYIEVGGGPNNLPSKYHTIIDHPGKKGGSFKNQKQPAFFPRIFSGKEKKKPITIRKSSTPTDLHLLRDTPFMIDQPKSPVNELTSETGSEQSDMDNLAPLEPVTKAVQPCDSVLTKTHCRTLSLESYFCEVSEECSKNNMDSSLELTELRESIVNFQVEENEMKIFSEDEDKIFSEDEDKIISALSPGSVKKHPDSSQEQYDPQKVGVSSNSVPSPQSEKNVVKGAKMEEYSLTISPSIKFIDSSSSYDLALGLDSSGLSDTIVDAVSLQIVRADFHTDEIAVLTTDKKTEISSMTSFSHPYVTPDFHQLTPSHSVSQSDDIALLTTIEIASVDSAGVNSTLSEAETKKNCEQKTAPVELDPKQLKQEELEVPHPSPRSIELEPKTQIKTNTTNKKKEAAVNPKLSEAKTRQQELIISQDKLAQEKQQEQEKLNNIGKATKEQNEKKKQLVKLKVPEKQKTRKGNQKRQPKKPKQAKLDNKFKESQDIQAELERQKAEEELKTLQLELRRLQAKTRTKKNLENAQQLELMKQLAAQRGQILSDESAQHLVKQELKKRRKGDTEEWQISCQLTIDLLKSVEEGKGVLTPMCALRTKTVDQALRKPSMDSTLFSHPHETPEFHHLTPSQPVVQSTPLHLALPSSKSLLLRSKPYLPASINPPSTIKENTDKATEMWTNSIHTSPLSNIQPTIGTEETTPLHSTQLTEDSMSIKDSPTSEIETEITIVDTNLGERQDVSAGLTTEEKEEFHWTLSKRSSFESSASQPAETPPSISTTSADSIELSSSSDTQPIEETLQQPNSDSPSAASLDYIHLSTDDTVTPDSAMAISDKVTTSNSTLPSPTIQLRTKENRNVGTEQVTPDFGLPPLPKSTPPKFFCTAKVLSPQPYSKHPILSPQPFIKVPHPSPRSIELEPKTQIKTNNTNKKQEAAVNSKLSESETKKTCAQKTAQVELAPKQQKNEELDNSRKATGKQNKQKRQPTEKQKAKKDKQKQAKLERQENERLHPLVEQFFADQKIQVQQGEILSDAGCRNLLHQDSEKRKEHTEECHNPYKRGDLLKNVEKGQGVLTPIPATRTKTVGQAPKKTSVDSALFSHPHETPEFHHLTPSQPMVQSTPLLLALPSSKSLLLQSKTLLPASINPPSTIKENTDMTTEVRNKAPKKPSPAPRLALRQNTPEMKPSPAIRKSSLPNPKPKEAALSFPQKSPTSEKQIDVKNEKKLKFISTVSLNAEDVDEVPPLTRRNSIHSIPFVDVNDPDTRIRMERYKNERRSTLRAKYKEEDYLSYDFREKQLVSVSPRPRPEYSDTTLDKFDLVTPGLSKQTTADPISAVTPVLGKQTIEHNTDNVPMLTKPRPDDFECAKLNYDSKHPEDDVNVKERAIIFGPIKSAESMKVVNIIPKSVQNTVNNMCSPSKIKNMAALFEKQ